MDEDISAPSESKLPIIFAAVALLAGVLGLLFGWSARSKISALEDAVKTTGAQALEARSLVETSRNSGVSRGQIAALEAENANLRQELTTLQANTQLAFTNFRKAIQDIAANRPINNARGGRTVIPPPSTPPSGGTSVAVAIHTPAAAGEHIVKAGENFTRIGRQYGVTAAEIVAANPDVNPNRLGVGQKIKIPAKR